MTDETTSERIARVAAANGLTVDTADAEVRIRAARYDWTDGTHFLLKDDEVASMLKAVAENAGAARSAEAEKRVNPINAHLLGRMDAEFVAQLGGLDWNKLSPANKITMDRNYRATGNVNGAKPDAKAALDAEFNGRALLGLEQGRGATVDAAGNLRPDNLSALDKLKLAHATGDTSKPVPPRQYTMAEMPPAVRAERNPHKRADLIEWVKAADKARDTLASGKYIPEGERAALEAKVARGWGGSIRARP